MTKKSNAVPTPDDVAREWIELKAEKLRIEKRTEVLKGMLQTYLKTQPEQTALFQGFKFKLYETTRQSFSLAEAREKIDGRVLAPYITTSVSQSIRTTWQGGEAEAAA